MPKVELHPEVYGELEHSRSWYEEKSKNLGMEFLAEVDLAIKAISEMPAVWPLYDSDKGLRRFLVHRFPYAVIYRYAEASIQVVAVMHMRRKPGYWQQRLSR